MTSYTVDGLVYGTVTPPTCCSKVYKTVYSPALLKVKLTVKSSVPTPSVQVRGVVTLSASMAVAVQAEMSPVEEASIGFEYESDKLTVYEYAVPATFSTLGSVTSIVAIGPGVTLNVVTAMADPPTSMKTSPGASVSGTKVVVPVANAPINSLKITESGVLTPACIKYAVTEARDCSVVSRSKVLLKTSLRLKANSWVAPTWNVVPTAPV